MGAQSPPHEKKINLAFLGGFHGPTGADPPLDKFLCTPLTAYKFTCSC